MISKQKRNNIFGIIILLLTTIVWGSAFTILKDTINVYPESYIVAIRFLGAGILCALIFIKSLRHANKKAVLSGIIIGLMVGIAYYVQTLGLKHTTASRNAFITAIYCVICPFLLWIIKKIKPKGYSVLSAIICIVGIGFIALSSDTSSQGGIAYLIGDLLTFMAAIFFALQIIFIEDCSNNIQTVLPIQLLTAGVLLAIISAVTELPTRPITDFIIRSDAIFGICYLTLVCTLLAQFGQFYGQKLCSSPNQSALILSLESVFGAFFSIILGRETPSVWLILGFVIVFIAILINVLKIDIFKLFRSKKRKS